MHGPGSDESPEGESQVSAVSQLQGVKGSDSTGREPSAEPSAELPWHLTESHHNPVSLHRRSQGAENHTVSHWQRWSQNLGWFILCVHLARLLCPSVSSNSRLDIAVKVFFGCDKHFLI